MKIVLAYVAVCNGPITEDYVARFVTTWLEYPPGVDHDTLVIANGGPLSTSTNLILSQMGARMFVRSNEGWDIQGYIEAARGPCANYDAMLCCGESVFFHREGWLKRFEDTWRRYGEGFYGPFSSNAVRAHLNTTAFFTSPSIIKSYPKHVSTREERYEYEHSEHALWRRVAARGLPVRLVTLDGEYPPFRWRMPRNILWRGDQTNCLMWCNHSEGYADADKRVKASWARRCDSPFK